MDNSTNSQRALWTFLGYMLVGPFFGGMAVAIVLALAPLLGLSGLLPGDLPPAGAATLSVFVWSVIPAAIAAIIIVPLVWRRGRLGWIEAAVAGVVGFFLAALVLEMPYRELLAQLAFLAGLVSLAVRQALVAGNIING